MPTIKLTSRALDTLSVPARGRVEYFDDSLAGFAVRVFPSGRKVFTLLYRMKGGRAQRKERVDIGAYPPLSRAQARDRASKLKAKIQLGKNPRPEREPAAPSHADIAGDSVDHTIQGVGQVTHVYAKYDFLEEKRQALDLWGRHLAALVKAKRRDEAPPLSERPAARPAQACWSRGTCGCSGLKKP